MRTLLLLAPLVTACAVDTPDIDARDPSSTAAVINGAPCEGRFPSAVAIVLDATLDRGNGVEDVTRLMCTGTLIAPDVVLTAGHCTDAKLLTNGQDTVSRAEFWVTSEVDLISITGTETPAAPLPADAVAVRELVAHEDFDIASCCAPGLGAVHDIALLFLDAPLEGVQPELVIAPEETAQLAVGTAVSFAGWGKQTAAFPSPDGTVGFKMCGEATIAELGDHEMQIGADEDITLKCQGDSGGPTYVDVAGDHVVSQRVIGVTSHQYDASGCTEGGIDTRVDAYFDWMNDHMTARCADGSRAWCDVEGVIPPSFFDDAPAAPSDPSDPQGCAALPAPLAAALLGLARRRRRR